LVERRPGGTSASTTLRSHFLAIGNVNVAWQYFEHLVAQRPPAKKAFSVVKMMENTVALLNRE